MSLASGPETSGGKKKGFDDALDFMISMSVDTLPAGEINQHGHCDPFFFNSLVKTLQ